MRFHRLRRRVPLAVLVLAGSVLAGASSARAITLEQKWTAGQQLNYDVLLNGTFNVKMPPEANNLLAGVPLDIDLNVKGQTGLDTLAVDELGVGTVVPRMGNLYVKADMLGQKMELQMRDGKGSFTMNGKAVGGGGNPGLDALTRPLVALHISKHGRIEGIVPLGTAGANAPPKPLEDGPPPNGPAETAPPRAGDGANQRRNPLNVPAMVQSMILRALPALWPDNDVNVGDKWATEIKWPLVPAVPANPGTAAQPGGPAGPPADGAAPPAPLGKFDFTLRGEEEVAGRKTQRVAVKGLIETDEAKTAALARTAAPVPDAANAKEPGRGGGAAPAAPRLQYARQEIKGDLWLDPEAGQIVRVELDIQSHVVGQAPGANRADGRADGRANNGARPAPAGDSEITFSGTLQMQLRKVSYASTPADAPMLP